MDTKPKKPEKKLKPLETAVALSKDTTADTTALETAAKGVAAALKTLEAAMGKSHLAHDKMYKQVPNADTSKPGPIPISYPNFTKMEKDAQGAVKTTQKAQKTLDAAHKKLVRVIDQQIKVLKPAATKSGGDEAATLKGLISAKAITKSYCQSWSMNVKVEGDAVVRLGNIVKAQQP